MFKSIAKFSVASITYIYVLNRFLLIIVVFLRQLVDCNQSEKQYDANQPLALSYRRVNAAYLPVDEVHDPLTLSLLSDIRTTESNGKQR